MALPNDLVPMDFSYGGLPFVVWAPSTLDTSLMDTAYGGLPFYAQPATPPNTTLSPNANVITLTAPGLYLKALDRTFPLKRSEDQRESQVRHTSPPIGVQDTSLIP